MNKRGEVSVCSEVGEIASPSTERGEKLVPSTVPMEEVTFVDMGSTNAKDSVENTYLSI